MLHHPVRKQRDDFKPRQKKKSLVDIHKYLFTSFNFILLEVFLTVSLSCQNAASLTQLLLT